MLIWHVALKTQTAYAYCINISETAAKLQYGYRFNVILTCRAHALMLYEHDVRPSVCRPNVGGL